jgi:DNA-binding phage protein
MDTMTFEHHTYDDMTVEQLAHIRDYGLERVYVVTAVLKKQVKASHERGVNIKKLARQAGVTRPTIYKWLSE